MPIWSTPNRANETLSVLDPRRPENRRDCGNGRGSFVWRGPRAKRIPKVEFSLGWELEADHEAARVPSGVERISDGSVNGDSAEYIVLPSVVRSARFSLGLLKDLVHAPELNTDKSCGYHVHLAPKSTALNKMREWAINCQMLAQRVEETAFLAVPQARQANNYCRRIELLTHGTRFSASKYSNDRRYHWLNVVEMFRPGGIRTVEIRLLGNTHRWKYLLAWSTFCLMLANGAWRLVYSPEDIEQVVNALNAFLKGIAEEIKPFEKRSEPIPEWVYKKLDQLGIDHSKWNRPLAKLVDAECEVSGRRKVFYSDAQATIDNESSDDSCPCGCGSDGRCDSQIHDDGDCHSSECVRCCENGDCNGSPDCFYCRDNAHSERMYCGSNHCTRCEARGFVPVPIVQRVFIDESVNVVSGVPAGSYVGIVHPSNISSEEIAQAEHEAQNSNNGGTI